jgi:hypothetical protein
MVYENLDTPRERALSNNIVMIDTSGKYINLTGILTILFHLGQRDEQMWGICLFPDPSDIVLGCLMTCGLFKKFMDLAVLLRICDRLDCYKDHDRFYGILGILGYKDFVIDYNMPKDELEKKIVQYAYSKGDVSWMALGGNNANGFLQPLHGKLNIIAGGLKSCEIVLDDEILTLECVVFGTVYNRKYFSSVRSDDRYYRIMEICKNWGVKLEEMIPALYGYNIYNEEEIRDMAMYLLNTPRNI